MKLLTVCNPFNAYAYADIIHNILKSRNNVLKSLAGSNFGKNKETMLIWSPVQINCSPGTTTAYHQEICKYTIIVTSDRSSIRIKTPFDLQRKKPGETSANSSKKRGTRQHWVRCYLKVTPINASLGRTTDRGQRPLRTLLKPSRGKWLLK